MDINYYRDGYLKDFEVKITMKVFIEGDEYEGTYEEKKERVENLIKSTLRDKDIVRVFDVKAEGI